MLASRLLTAAKVQNKGKTITTTINKRQARAVLLTWSWCPERNPSSASCKESYRRVVLAARLLFALLRSALTASFTRSPRWRLSLARAARSQSERSTTRWLTSDDQEQEVRVTLFCSFFFCCWPFLGSSIIGKESVWKWVRFCNISEMKEIYVMGYELWSAMWKFSNFHPCLVNTLG